MKYFIKTIGCRTNQAEHQWLHEKLFECGHVLDEKNPELVVVFSCTVTAIADRKTRQIVKNLLRKGQNLKVILTGCGVRNEKIDKSFFENSKRVLMLKNVQEVFNWIGNNFENDNVIGQFIAEKTRSIIKVQEGCENFCAYCIIPYVRGKERSVALDSILEQIKKHEKRGVKEVVLTGTHLAKWGKDFDKKLDLHFLVEHILAATTTVRIRLSSLEPQDYEDSLLNLFKNPRICRHLHLALQSGSDEILQRMGRRYDVKFFQELMNKFNQKYDDIAMTTDVIVGFPGESDELFLESYNFLKNSGLAKLHVFPYSRREGTRAYDFKNGVLINVRRKRADLLRRLSVELEMTFKNRFVGQTIDVLFESFRAGKNWGVSGNYIKVFVEGEKSLHNQRCLVKVKRLCVETGCLEGIIIDTLG